MPGDSSNLPDEHRARVRVLNQRGEIDRLESELLDAVDRAGYTKASRFAVRLALEEALANAFHHGHKGLAPTTPVIVEFAVRPSDITIRVEDQGPGFDPATVRDPTLDENLEAPSGRGLMLMRAYMTRVEHSPRGNIVTMHYRRPA